MENNNRFTMVSVVLFSKESEKPIFTQSDMVYNKLRQNFSVAHVAHVDYNSIVSTHPGFVRHVSEKTIGNLLMVISQLGIELGGVFSGREEEDVEADLVSLGLVRRDMDLKQIEHGVTQLKLALPNINWDTNSLADALFTHPEDVSRVLDK